MWTQMAIEILAQFRMLEKSQRIIGVIDLSAELGNQLLNFLSLESCILDIRFGLLNECEFVPRRNQQAFR